MGVFGFLRDKNVLVWLMTTLLPSLLPVVTTAAAATTRSMWPTEFDEYIKMSDVVFIGLTINIANLSMWKTDLYEDEKMTVMVASGFLLIFLSVFLVGAYNNPSLHVGTRLIIVILVSVSVCINFTYNKRLWKRSKHFGSH